ncbi:type 2 isopentenyl-diphosphate Delta-isomerase [Jeotgalibacillus sp. S-D1]|uniref:type 2 isopentenyl-diphosphate Delta-isomerase n=1 Tax=Jeotgalibacillus sp. S-D1 TaxID=2552189 RepID=UPI001059DB9D|nr:type 2 isopentenyl-diphosphate Delta-isomerase [Jeotgalibacillus sp. S-D1]TDL34721.1 type 2 isopentenyl-diphosphate Delta-isomerase [Jeotgalibacillus sp. S-D1]
MSRAERKLDHINYALSTGASGGAGFDDVTFVHQSLPNTALDDISLHIKLGELQASSPFFINAMTGGGGAKTEQLNKELSIAAKETGLMLSVGSQMAAIKDSSERASYSITRKMNPKGIIIGNLGSEATVDQAKMAVDMLEANAIQIHLNVIQELAMPEGDRSFCGALGRIEAISKELEVPVIVKETGFGISREAAVKLSNAGASVIDVGGFGGTNFSKIENHRQTRELSFFNQWGIPTVPSIVETAGSADCPIVASGGIQSSLDIIKAISLGASSVGVAGLFLKTLINEGVEELIDEIKWMQYEQKTIMTALGAKSIPDLWNVPLVISGSSYHWLHTRGMEPDRFAKRSL